MNPSALLAAASADEPMKLSQVFSYALFLIASVMFVLALKWLSAPKTARRGNITGEIGMAVAIIGALLHYHIISYEWIVVGFVIGALIGAPMAIWMPMTAVPQRTALSHAFGALAAALVGTAHFYLFDLKDHPPHAVEMAFLCVEVLLGALTFTGSLMAFGKLQELLPTRPMVYKNQNIYNLGVLALAIATAVLLICQPQWSWLFPVLLVLSLAFGVLLIMPIGGADMPTVIALLNSYAGLSASMMGFVLNSKLLIIAGALDGASGLILSIIMCKAMNRSFTNVLFGAFGQVQPSTAVAGEKKTVRSASRRGSGTDPRRRAERDRRARVWHGRRASATQGARAIRSIDPQRRERSFRDSPGCRPHARPHECPAGRGGNSLRQARRDGRHQ